MTPAKIFVTILLSLLGMGYFAYGKKQQRLLVMACGGALMGIPYFVSGTGWLLLAGGLLAIAPFVADRYLD